MVEVHDDLVHTTCEVATVAAETLRQQEHDELTGYDELVVACGRRPERPAGGGPSLGSAGRALLQPAASASEQQQVMQQHGRGYIHS